MANSKLPLFPTIGKVLKKSFAELYLSMGFTILISLIWAIGYLLILLAITPVYYQLTTHKTDLRGIVVFGLLAATMINTLIAGPLTTTLYGFYQERKESYVSFKVFFQILRKVYWRSAGIHGLYWLVNTLLIFNVVSTSVNQNFLFKVSGLFSMYCVFFFGMMPFFFHPLLNLNQTVKATIRKSFLLLLDNFGISFWLNLVLFLLLMMSSVVPFVMVFLLLGYGAFLIYVIDYAFEMIWNKY